MKSVSANKWSVIAQNSSEDALLRMLSSPMLEMIYAAQAELARRSCPMSARPNLDKWTREMREKKRTAFDLDELWRKACDEMNRKEWDLLFIGYALAEPPPSWDA